jgi:hypothetical protein
MHVRHERNVLVDEWQERQAFDLGPRRVFERYAIDPGLDGYAGVSMICMGSANSTLAATNRAFTSAIAGARRSRT